jgi:hypothetical protein
MNQQLSNTAYEIHAWLRMTFIPSAMAFSYRMPVFSKRFTISYKYHGFAQEALTDYP